MLASTTSLQDSGLLDQLIPAFESEHRRWRVKVVAVGSGEALELGRNGDADVILAHSPEAETTYMDEGHGLSRTAVMKNRFMVVGPHEDPAGVRGTDSAQEAFRRIASSASLFVSRADRSGTHTKELLIWRLAGIAPSDDWYLSSGQGMAETLAITVEKNAYTLTDSSTFISLRRPADVLYEDDPLLENRYSVIIARKAKTPSGARAFLGWLTAQGQEVIANHGVARYGEPLFEPEAEGP